MNLLYEEVETYDLDDTSAQNFLKEVEGDLDRYQQLQEDLPVDLDVQLRIYESRLSGDQRYRLEVEGNLDGITGSKGLGFHPAVDFPEVLEKLVPSLDERTLAGKLNEEPRSILE